MKQLSIILFFYATLLSCANKENLAPSHPLDESLAKPYSLLTLGDRIDAIGSVPDSNTWEDMDKLYRSEVAGCGNHDYKNMAVFWMVSTLGLTEKANDDVIKYYLSEIEKNDFNTNLKLIVRLLERAKSFWDDQQIASYSQKLVEKNKSYWAKHFVGQTSYLDINEIAFTDLQKLSDNLR